MELERYSFEPRILKTAIIKTKIKCLKCKKARVHEFQRELWCPRCKTNFEWENKPKRKLRIKE